MNAAAGNAELEMQRAEQAWRSASTLFEHELLEDSVSRAYYAVLHAAKAALIRVDAFPVTHHGVRRMFGLHLVKTGLIEAEFAVILTAGQEDRELSDYDVTVNIEEDRAQKRLSDARRFLDRIHGYLQETNE